ncbi:MAG: RNA polymerase sigma factor [Ignavibacteriales bacterium]|jgi:RNA polymerase sigma-70 factor (ECF subfamily)|nr:RNA polymerase sigma factor [Ignavibacteriales bacterium]MBK8663122.1 RNA polymerase sigma factor [Ignavibacteriales bacterium]
MQDILDFTLYYNRYKKKLFNYTLRMTGNRMATEDILQITFMRFFQNMGNIKHGVAIEFWLFKVVRNEIYTWLRSKKKLSENYLSDDISEINLEADETADAQLLEGERKEIVLKAINSLSSEQKEVILLKEFSGLSYDEISEVCGIDTGLVKSRLYSARQKLIAQLSNKINM